MPNKTPTARNLTRWINQEVENLLTTWSRMTKFDCSNIISEISRIRKEHKNHLSVLQTNFFEDEVKYVICLEVRLQYRGIDAEFTEDDWDSSWSPGFTDDHSAVEEILDKLLDEYLGDIGINKNDLTKEKLDEYYEQIKEKHIDGIEAAFDQAVEAAEEVAWDEASDLVSKTLEPQVTEFIISEADLNFLDFTSDQLETIFRLTTTYVDLYDPVDVFLDGLIKELGSGFSEISSKMIKQHKDRIKQAVVENILQNNGIQELIERFDEATDNSNYVDMQRVYVVCARTVKQVVHTKVNALQDNLSVYVTDYDDFQRYGHLDSDGGFNIVSPKRKVVTLAPEDPLEKYHIWLSEVENFYKVFPQHSSTETLLYSSSKCPNTKNAEYNIFPLFSEMRERGNAAHEILTKHINDVSIQEQQRQFAEKNAEKQEKQNELAGYRAILDDDNVSKTQKKKLPGKIAKVEKRIVVVEREIDSAWIKTAVF